MLFKKLPFYASLLICVSAGYAQVTLNQLPTREIGHSRLLPNLGFENVNPNLVEGREMYQPAGIALDNTATPPILYVSDSQNNRILVWKNALSFSNGKAADRILGQLSPSATTAQGPSSNPNVRSTGFFFPTGLAVLQGDLYVVDSGNNRIMRFRKPLNTPEDQLRPDLVIGQANFNSRNPNAPSGQITTKGIGLNLGGGAFFSGAIVFDRNNNLWFTDAGNNRILRYDAADISGNNVFAPDAKLELGQLDFVSRQALLPSTDAGRKTKNQLNAPSAIAFDTAGRLYVADANNSDPLNFSRVVVFTPPFTPGMNASRIMGVLPQQVQGAPAITDPQFYAIAMNAPSAIFFLPGTQGMGVVDAGYSRILLFDIFDQWPDEATAFSPSARAVVGHQSGIGGINLLDAKSLYGNDGNPQSSASTFVAPEAVVFTGTELFVADTLNNRVIVMPYTGSTFAPATRLLGQDRFDSNQPNLIEGREFNFNYRGSLDSAMALDITGDAPRLYVSDPGNHRILGFKDIRVLKAGDTADIVIGQPDFATALCNYPAGVVGKPTQSSLCRPVGLVVDKDGNLYVADSLNGRVLRFPTPFSHKGNQVADFILGQADFSSPKATDPTNRQMLAPYGLAFAGNNGLLVSDQALNRVLFFPFTSGGFTSADNFKAATKVFGQPDFVTATAGNTDTGLSNPHHISADTDGRPYVVDTGNGRVLIYDQTLNNPATGSHAALALGGLSVPTAINVNPNTGEIWVGEAGTGLIRKYPKYDTLVLRPLFTETFNTVASPLAVVQDQFGDLLVADHTNRITFYFPGLTVLNGANFMQGRALAPGTFSTIFPLPGGTFNKDVGDITTLPNPIPYPKILGDVQVLVNDVPAPLTYTDRNQVNFVVPWKTNTDAGADVQVIKFSTGQVLAAGVMAMGPVSPGVFETTHAGAVRQAAVINSKTGTVNSPTNPAARGDFIEIYATGLGPVTTTPNDGDVPSTLSSVTGNLRVFFANCALDTCPLSLNEQGGFLTFAGLSPSFPGLYQVNMRIPQAAEPGVPALLVITVNSVGSNVSSVTGYNTYVYVAK